MKLGPKALLPALVLVVPALAQAVVNLSQFDLPTFSLRRTTTLIIGLVLGVTLFSQAMDFAKQNPLAYLVGAESREQFLVRQWGDHARAMFALNQLPATARVQFMWEPRSYYAMRPARADPLLDALPHLVSVSGDLDAAVQRLKADGFTHVLIFEAGARFAFDNQINQYTPADAENLRRLRSAHARTVYENGSYRLLELK